MHTRVYTHVQHHACIINYYTGVQRLYPTHVKNVHILLKNIPSIFYMHIINYINHFQQHTSLHYSDFSTETFPTNDVSTAPSSTPPPKAPPIISMLGLRSSSNVVVMVGAVVASSLLCADSHKYNVSPLTRSHGTAVFMPFFGIKQVNLIRFFYEKNIYIF